jgi:hypothetical protein
MQTEYNDILKRIAAPPLGWLDGVPRYDTFHPREVEVYAHEVALVHVECQECSRRYDVAVRRGPFGSLRDNIAYENELPVGDPPRACPEQLSMSHAGATMSALQISVLEFWSREGHPIPRWQRDHSMERPLADAIHNQTGEIIPDRPVFLRIHESMRKDDWMRANEDGNFSKMVSILTQFECNRPVEVAQMLDYQRRNQIFLREIVALRKQRIG